VTLRLKYELYETDYYEKLTIKSMKNVKNLKKNDLGALNLNAA
jgi:hypothetical protein